jgi:uncharacterized SAM-binding protein YcdF (DUF218 family)
MGLHLSSYFLAFRNPNIYMNQTVEQLSHLYQHIYYMMYFMDGVIVLPSVIWSSFFFGGLSISTSVVQIVYAGGIPFSRIWCEVHPKYKLPANVVWLCAFYPCSYTFPS